MKSETLPHPPTPSPLRREGEVRARHASPLQPHPLSPDPSPTQAGRGEKRGWAIAVIAGLILLIGAACTATPTPSTGATAVPPSAVPSTTIPSTATTAATAATSGVTPITLAQGSGATKGFWEVYFNAPTGSRDASTYTGGIDEILAADIGNVTQTLDIAAYEFNDPALTTAVLAAKGRGVRVRVVTDDDAGINDAETTLHQLEAAGIPIVNDNRSALMHNKFMILDSATVWTGSWNYTVNGTFRNNNNALVLHSQNAVQDYQAEFNEMFVDGKFGPTSPVNTPHETFTQDGDPIGIYFASEEDVKTKVDAALQTATHSIRFLTFSFTLDDVGQVLLDKAGAGVDVSGIFETTGSQTKFSELTPLFCAGLPVRQDGNPFVLHDKVFIVDNATVLTGSYNYSASANDSNDENLVIITDPDLAQQYSAEFDRRWAEATTPSGLSCN